MHMGRNLHCAVLALIPACPPEQSEAEAVERMARTIGWPPARVRAAMKKRAWGASTIEYVASKLEMSAERFRTLQADTAH